MKFLSLAIIAAVTSFNVYADESGFPDRCAVAVNGKIVESFQVSFQNEDEFIQRKVTVDGTDLLIQFIVRDDVAPIEVPGERPLFGTALGVSISAIKDGIPARKSFASELIYFIGKKTEYYPGPDKACQAASDKDSPLKKSLDEDTFDALQAFCKLLRENGDVATIEASGQTRISGKKAKVQIACIP